MSRTKLQKNEADHAFVGEWHIYEMEIWDEDYFNMETQAYVQIESYNGGSFQFGLVIGDLDGHIEKLNEGERFSFTWEGSDEMDSASGSGWIKLISPNEIEGVIKFHHGDKSSFKAKKVENQTV